MLTAIKWNLRNALVIAKPNMKLTDENYRGMLATVDLLSDERFLKLGIGEDVASMDAQVTLADDRLTVAADQEAGVVTFYKATYAYDILHVDVILDGVGVSWEIVKSYPDATTKVFNAAQIPLKSDNVTLRVTIQPGGHLKRAVVLQRIEL